MMRPASTYRFYTDSENTGLWEEEFRPQNESQYVDGIILKTLETIRNRRNLIYIGKGTKPTILIPEIDTRMAGQYANYISIDILHLKNNLISPCGGSCKVVYFIV